jgi:DNA-binding response OmpR family regulator
VNARMLVVTADKGLADLLRPQVENQGADCSVAESYDEASLLLSWADSALVDLELPCGGLDAIERFQMEAPALRVLAIATREADALAAEALVVERVLREPFTIADVVEAVRSVAAGTGDAPVIDLRAPVTEAAQAVPVQDDLPWWATR